MAPKPPPTPARPSAKPTPTVTPPPPSASAGSSANAGTGSPAQVGTRSSANARTGSPAQAGTRSSSPRPQVTPPLPPPPPQKPGTSTPPPPKIKPETTAPPPSKPETTKGLSPHEILTNKDGTWAGISSPKSDLPPPPVDPIARGSGILDENDDPSPSDDPQSQNIRPTRTIRPLTWYQKISVNSILGGGLHLLKRLTAFPMLSSAAIYFDEDDRFDPSGNRKTEPANDSEEDMNPPSERVEVAVNYERATQALFEAIIRYRKEAKFAKDNYHTMKVNLAQFPEWNDNLIDRLRSTFQVFDITGDGLLDFEEFCTTLDEFGDGTSLEVRKKYFASIDDGSGSIDFLEFLRLVYKLTIKTPNGAEELAETFQSIDRNMGRIRSLDVVQQLQAGLF